MDDFTQHFAAQGQAPQHQPIDAQSMDSDVQDIYGGDGDSNQIVTHAPKSRFRLGYFDVMCLVVNFMIGTGVFNSHTRVMQGTNSTGASLLLWFAGIIYCICGTHVYIEYGLNVPRYTINGIEQSVPRSGGDLNYLQYVYQKPTYRKNTIQLVTCLFGVGFIAFGNMAGNAINFATRSLRAAGVDEPKNGDVRGIAIAVATLTCFIHAFSRRGGILLNNFFAIVKLSILLLIVILAIVVAAGGIKGTDNIINENTKSSAAFDKAEDDANGYAHAFLAIIFSFWGFEQPNYIMGEISHARRKFPISMSIGVVLICTMYMACTISYMVVVPKEEQSNPDKVVAQRFFEMTIGRVAGSEEIGTRVFNAFIAISSIGNMIVMTYTAARVKQEIAKEGILPKPKFFAQNTDLSLGRVLTWLRAKGYFARLLQTSWLRPEHHSEKTPVGAFVLHFLSCLILIFATWGMTPDGAYDLLTTLSVYVINCFFGFWVGLGILILRWRGPPATASAANHQTTTTPVSWKTLTGPGINPYLSVFCASFFTLCNAWPVVTTWVPPVDERIKTKLFAWWLIPTVAWAVIVFGLAWFLGFLAVARNIKRKHHKVFTVERKPEFESDEVSDSHDRRDDGLILIHETTYLSWIGTENSQGGHAGFEMVDQGSGAKPNSDFAQYLQDQPQRQHQPQQQQHMNGFNGQPQPSPLPQAGLQPPFHQHQHQRQDQFTQSPFQQQGSFQQPHQPQQQHSYGQTSRGYTNGFGR